MFILFDKGDDNLLKGVDSAAVRSRAKNFCKNPTTASTFGPSVMMATVDENCYKEWMTAVRGGCHLLQLFIPSAEQKCLAFHWEVPLFSL